MKKELFEIRFDYIDVDLSTNIKISKSEFKKQFNFLKSQVEETKENEYKTEYFCKTNDFETYTLISHYFSVGCATTYLYHYKCKDGYCFK